MSGNKYISIGSTGEITEIASSNSSAGSGDSGKIVSLNSSGQVDSTMLPTSGLITMTATESISAGALINVYDVAGASKIRNADNTTIAKQAHGFAPTAIASSASGSVNIGNGADTALTGLTDGVEYFLGAAGAVVVGASIPTATGSIVQKVGVSRSATELDVILQNPIVRA